MSPSSLQPTQLTATEAPGFVADVVRAAGSGVVAGPVQIDLSALRTFDSAGLAALVNVAAKAQLLHAPEKLRTLAALYGMGRIFS